MINEDTYEENEDINEDNLDDDDDVVISHLVDDDDDDDDFVIIKEIVNDTENPQKEEKRKPGPKPKKEFERKINLLEGITVKQDITLEIF